jgi:hypothetical protein
VQLLQKQLAAADESCKEHHKQQSAAAHRAGEAQQQLQKRGELILQLQVRKRVPPVTGTADCMATFHSRLYVQDSRCAMVNIHTKIARAQLHNLQCREVKTWRQLQKGLQLLLKADDCTMTDS